ncbi:Os10g0175066 [Oryza sativa Japonica Group]|uniref:Os10g0175066 protein n=1 Tax=Oryza sativa subsp. japonica TaxID=39947 RepID=A0A0P0XT78_ORYSJ|nr:Os10g0175066 [Oryza sativa Japonica Group]
MQDQTDAGYAAGDEATGAGGRDVFASTARHAVGGSSMFSTAKRLTTTKNPGVYGAAGSAPDGTVVRPRPVAPRRGSTLSIDELRWIRHDVRRRQEGARAAESFCLS